MGVCKALLFYRIYLCSFLNLRRTKNVGVNGFTGPRQKIDGRYEFDFKVVLKDLLRKIDPRSEFDFKVVLEDLLCKQIIAATFV